MATETDETEEDSKAEAPAPIFDLSKVTMSDKDVDALAVWVEFKYGISFKLKFVPRSDLQRLSRDSTEMKWNEQIKGRVPEISSDKLVPAFCKRAVSDWKGMTPNSLAKLIPIKLEQVDETIRDQPISFTQAQLVQIVRSAYELDVFLQQSASDLSLFNSEFEAEAKN